MATLAQSFKQVWTTPKGFISFLSAVNNRAIGARYIATSLIFFLIGGVQALLMRTQLMVPENTFLGPNTYNEFFTMHGTTMMFLYAVPVLEGFATYLIPLMTGSRDLPFPRLTTFGYWCFLFGGIFLYAGFFVGAVPDDGWFAYVPLSAAEYSPDLGMDFWLLGLTLAEIATITGGIELIVAFFKLRAPGMSLNRIPILVWETLIVAFMIIFGFVPLIVASIFLELQRKIGAQFYDPEFGGDPLLWQHLFWIMAHPLVYIQFLPGAGIVSMIIPVFARRRIVAYTLIILALIATGFLSFGVWAHHMFATGIPLLGLTFFSGASLVIILPTATQIFAWIVTTWTGRLYIRTPYLFAIGWIFILVMGGINGVMTALVPFDWQLHDSYFVLAHLHAVLIGSNLFGVFAGLYYWFPKMTGRMLSERVGRWHFWFVFIGFFITFFPWHMLGLWGMPRRIYTYEAGLGWAGMNFISTIGAYIMGVGILLFLVNVVLSLWGGEEAGDNPWGADSLEWATESPPPPYGFRQIPIVHSLNPLWDQERLDVGDEETMRIVEALEARPTTWRATLATTSLDARPDAIVHLPGPTYIPLVTALAVTLFFGGLLVDNFWLAGLGVLATIAAGIYWLWPNRETWHDSEETFARYGLPVNVSGHRATPWWGMVAFIAVAATSLATLVASYGYLTFDVAEWPPVPVDDPGIGLPLVAGVLVLLSAFAIFLAKRGIERDSQTALHLGLAASFTLGMIALAVQFLHYGAQVEFSPWFYSYGSIFWAVAGFQLLMESLGLIMMAVVLIRATIGHFDGSRYLAVENTALFWYFVTVSWIVVFLTLYVSPELL